jgi:tetratricopeptide (TPR) repeat protein/CHAT domain-containing protein
MIRRRFIVPCLLSAVAMCCASPDRLAAAAQMTAGQDKEIVVLQVAGKLTGTDARDRVRKGSHHRVHEVPLQAGKHYLIDLVSADFDPFLRLENDTGKQLAEDDDSGGGTKARLVFAAPGPGRYRIIGTSFKSGETGAYRLTVKEISKAQAERIPLEDEVKRLNEEGLAHFRKGQYRNALRSMERALAMRERLYPTQDHPDLAESLNNLGFVLNAMGHARMALPYCERALAMDERLYSKQQDHPDLAMSLNNLGLVVQALGQAGQALPYYERALAMRERLYPDQNHPDLAMSLNNLGFVFWALGQAGKALPYCERALAMCERLYPKQDHPDLATSLNNLGGVLEALGQAGKALPYCQRALAMRKRLYPKQDHPDLAVSLNNLGAVLNVLGQAGKALHCHERALAIYERLYVKQDHPDLVASLNNLGFVLRALGQAGKALPHHERAVAMCERLYPKQNHPYLARSLNNLGCALHALGQAGKAVPYCERALAVCQGLYPKQDHPELAVGLNSLAFILGEKRKALHYYERALAMRERLYPDQDHPDLVESLNNLGFVLNALGQGEKALPHHERALAMCERLYPSQNHPDLAVSLNNLAGVLDALGNAGKAAPYLNRALAMYRNLSERDCIAEVQALSRAAGMPRTRDGYLSATRVLPSPENAYLNVWSSKATITRILQERRAAARLVLSGSWEHKTDWEALLLVRGQLTFWLNSPVKDPHERDHEVQKLNARKEELERRLAKAVPELPRRKKLDKLGPTELLARLAPHAAFIDLIRYRHYEKAITNELRYVAFVLANQGNVRRVELGPAEPIDLAVDLWRQAVSGWSPSLKPAVQRELESKANKHAADLRRLVWEPLAKHLPKDTHTVYLAPDGNLARFAFAALPGSKPGTVLLEELNIAYVPHGPALLERLVYPPQFPKGPGDALLVGGVGYDPDPVKMGTPWQPLKATTQELNDLKVVAGKRQVLPLSGLDASTTRLNNALPKVRYAHLATHGFFKEDEFSQERKRLNEQLKNWVMPIGDKTTALGGQGVQSPLVYTGLVLAGANLPDKAGPGGGILSGEMIVDLPLEGLRLAVLSACDTGLGEVTGGEGVRNLQLAFHLAGCPDVIASLWQVNDRATAVLMAKFYYELWVKDRPPLEALREAQLFVYLRPDLVAELAGDERAPPRVHEARRQEVLERGVAAAPAQGVEAGPRRTATKLWAAFVLSGTGR